MNKIFCLLVLVTAHSFSQTPLVLTQRDQAQVIDDILEDRLKNTLPSLMRREGIDLWILISRERSST